jgi:thioredoxin family protein
MTIDRARFDQGLTYDAYKEQMTRNRDRLDENERRVALSKEDLAAFRDLPRPVKVLVLAEDWCGDVIANLPVLGRLAKDSGKLDVRVFLRDQNDDIMQRYLNKGQFKSIPVFAFFDDDFRELGHWIERPASVTEVRAKRRKDIFAAHPEFGSPDAPVDQLAEDVRVRLQAELAKMRDETTKFANAEVVRELREIATRVAA